MVAEDEEPCELCEDTQQLMHLSMTPWLSCPQTKHVKPQREGESGQITQRESPIHHSNVMHYSKAQKARSRVGYKCAFVPSNAHSIAGLRA
jgi:hypothetical protein